VNIPFAVYSLFDHELKIYLFFLTFLRITSLMFQFPVLGEKTVPGIVKILLGLCLTVVLFPVVQAIPNKIKLETFSSTSAMIELIFLEIVFGLFIGFVSHWIFDAATFAGQFVSTTMGFSMASVLDPHQEIQTTPFAELQSALVMLLFLSMDGHYVLLRAISDSFQILPLGGLDFTKNSAETIQYLIGMSAEVLKLGIKMAAPILVVLLLVNLTFGILARAVPQINVLTVSFAANIIVGLFIAMVSLPGFANLVETSFENYSPEILRIMKVFSSG
jgi:flagellar biosynthetic protein FliR